jgi:uncharacterized protein
MNDLPEELQFTASRSAGEVSALLLVPGNARRLYVYAHGAGAGMRHPFMEQSARRLAAQGIATFRYQFPYMERMRRIDPAPILHATVRAAVAVAREAAPDLRVLAGGKSMGGRMTSQAQALAPLEGVDGLVFFGFPLHPPQRPSSERADHLEKVTIPMLFLQGTRDDLADLTLLTPICDRLGALARLHVVDGADHSFQVLKKSGRTDDDVLEGLAATVSAWAAELE